jgi:hypothetical protein
MRERELIRVPVPPSLSAVAFSCRFSCRSAADLADPLVILFPCAIFALQPIDCQRAIFRYSLEFRGNRRARISRDVNRYDEDVKRHV